jgi:hypothetical protein
MKLWYDFTVKCLACSKYIWLAHRFEKHNRPQGILLRNQKQVLFLCLLCNWIPWKVDLFLECQILDMSSGLLKGENYLPHEWPLFVLVTYADFELIFIWTGRTTAHPNLGLHNSRHRLKHFFFTKLQLYICITSASINDI